MLMVLAIAILAVISNVEPLKLGAKPAVPAVEGPTYQAPLYLQSPSYYYPNQAQLGYYPQATPIASGELATKTLSSDVRLLRPSTHLYPAPMSTQPMAYLIVRPVAHYQATQQLPYVAEPPRYYDQQYYGQQHLQQHHELRQAEPLPAVNEQPIEQQREQQHHEEQVKGVQQEELDANQQPIVQQQEEQGRLQPVNVPATVQQPQQPAPVALLPAKQVTGVVEEQQAGLGKGGKFLKIKSSIDKLAQSALSKLTLGSTYQVMKEEYLQPAAPLAIAVPAQPIRTPLYQQHEQQHPIEQVQQEDIRGVQQQQENLESNFEQQQQLQEVPRLEQGVKSSLSSELAQPEAPRAIKESQRQLDEQPEHRPAVHLTRLSSAQAAKNY